VFANTSLSISLKCFNCSCSEYERNRGIFCPLPPLICKRVLWFGWAWRETCQGMNVLTFLQIAFVSGLRWERPLWLTVS